MVTRLAWMAHKLVSSNRPTRYASEASCLLEGSDGSALESEIGFEVLSNLPDETLEGKFADQQLSRLLVTPDLTERHGTGPVPVGLLHSTSRGSRFPGSLGG